MKCKECVKYGCDLMKEEGELSEGEYCSQYEVS